MKGRFLMKGGGEIYIDRIVRNLVNATILAFSISEIRRIKNHPLSIKGELYGNKSHITKKENKQKY